MDPITQQLALAGAGIEEVTVDDIFDVTTYTGSGAARSITNGINFSSRGGLVWIKNRLNSGNFFHHCLYDTERNVSGVFQRLSSNLPDAESNIAGVTAFNSDGYDLVAGDARINSLNESYVAWSWRRQRKFFDVVTYTGDGTAGRAIPHSLGATPGMIMVKRRDVSLDWRVYHSGLGNTDYLTLNTNASATTSTNAWNNTSPTSTDFTVGTDLNNSGNTYVAYIYADDEDFIKCGSYTGPNNTAWIFLNFTPQFLMIKQTNSTGEWFVMDTTRGWATGFQNDLLLEWNTDDAETNYFNASDPGVNNFSIPNGLTGMNTSGDDFIYMAIAAP